MSRINDKIFNCAIYLYKSVQDAERGEKTGGSGFIVGVPSSAGGGYIYAVTNSHIIREANSPIIRINKKVEDFDIYICDTTDWYHHPDGDDLAVLPLSVEITKYRLGFVPIDLFVNAKIIKDGDIGAGDETFTIGRFIGYDGKQRNEPIVRFGNLSIGTPVGIEHERGYTQESYLVESRSLSGFSGSPVFIHILPMSYRPGLKGNVGTTRGPWLLGVDWGHKYTYESVREKNGEICNEGWKVKTNSGISCVVPAWKLYELLYIEELVEMRKTKDAETKKD